MSPDFGEIGFAGVGFVDELTVKHYDQTIRQFQQFVETFADQQHLDFAAVLPRQSVDVGMSENQRLHDKVSR